MITQISEDRYHTEETRDKEHNLEIKIAAVIMALLASPFKNTKIRIKNPFSCKMRKGLNVDIPTILTF